jgi:L-ascorbate metabolism protein UlaG (beta-lactamase superfamily)
MFIRWFGQSAFLVSGDQRVVIDPFGDVRAALPVGRWLYPPVEGVEADVLLVTHEHADHNVIDGVGGSPLVLRSTCGTLDSPLGKVVGVASEHDEVAGTERGANTIFVFRLQGLRFCHLGDFGQKELRSEQRQAIGDIDVLFVPIGGGPTVGGEASAQLVRDLRPRLSVPMHYRTEAIDMLDGPDDFLAALGAEVVRPKGSEFELEPLLGSGSAPRVVLPAPPVARALST